MPAYLGRKPPDLASPTDTHRDHPILNKCDAKSYFFVVFLLLIWIKWIVFCKWIIFLLFFYLIIALILSEVYNLQVRYGIIVGHYVMIITGYVFVIQSINSQLLIIENLMGSGHFWGQPKTYAISEEYPSTGARGTCQTNAHQTQNM